MHELEQQQPQRHLLSQQLTQQKQQQQQLQRNKQPFQSPANNHSFKGMNSCLQTTKYGKPSSPAASGNTTQKNNNNYKKPDTIILGQSVGGSGGNIFNNGKLDFTLYHNLIKTVKEQTNVSPPSVNTMTAGAGNHFSTSTANNNNKKDGNLFGLDQLDFPKSPSVKNMQLSATNNKQMKNSKLGALLKISFANNTSSSITSSKSKKNTTTTADFYFKQGTNVAKRPPSSQLGTPNQDSQFNFLLQSCGGGITGTKLQNRTATQFNLDTATLQRQQRQQLQQQQQNIQQQQQQSSSQIPQQQQQQQPNLPQQHQHSSINMSSSKSSVSLVLSGSGGGGGSEQKSRQCENKSSKKIKSWMSCTPSSVIKQYLKDMKSYNDYRQVLSSNHQFNINLKHPYFITEQQDATQSSVAEDNSRLKNDDMMLKQCGQSFDSDNFEVWKQNLHTKMISKINKNVSSNI